MHCIQVGTHGAAVQITEREGGAFIVLGGVTWNTLLFKQSYIFHELDWLCGLVRDGAMCSVVKRVLRRLTDRAHDSGMHHLHSAMDAVSYLNKEFPLCVPRVEMEPRFKKPVYESFLKFPEVFSGAFLRYMARSAPITEYQPLCGHE